MRVTAIDQAMQPYDGEPYGDKDPDLPEASMGVSVMKN
jgi:hypothetical protein